MKGQVKFRGMASLSARVFRTELAENAPRTPLHRPSEPIIRPGIAAVGRVMDRCFGSVFRVSPLD